MKLILPAHRRQRFIVRHAHITQNKKFAISFQAVEKEVTDAIHFFEYR